MCLILARWILGQFVNLNHNCIHLASLGFLVSLSLASFAPPLRECRVPPPAPTEAGMAQLEILTLSTHGNVGMDEPLPSSTRAASRK